LLGAIALRVAKKLLRRHLFRHLADVSGAFLAKVDRQRDRHRK